MADKTTIEWTDATWNPVRGCAIVSKGCTNCYAMRQAHRSNRPGGAYEGLTKLTKGGPVWTGAARTVPELLGQPGRWRRPRRIFVNSMSDLFHEDVPDAFIAQVWQRMAWNQQHVFQILTKRPERMLQWVHDHGGDAVFAGEREEYEESLRKHGWPLRNVWLGVSVEDQASWDARVPALQLTPAAVRWISAEPLLERIDMRIGLWNGPLHWLVAGGESGPGARPTHPDWVRSLRDQCGMAGVRFFFKQWGAWMPFGYVDAATGHPMVKLVFSEREKVIGGPAEGTAPCNVRRVGKKAAGRELDGRTHDDYPLDRHEAQQKAAPKP